MATPELVRALNELMTIGIWKTKDGLMGEAIRIRPSSFAQLTNDDAFRIINHGNDIVMNNGKSPVYIEPLSSNNSGDERKETVGRCVDLWKNDDMPSDTPKKRPRGFEDPHLNNAETSFMNDLSHPRPIKRKDYFVGGFTVDTERTIKGTIVNAYPSYADYFSFPVRGYPGDDIVRSGISETKIEVVGSAKVEEVES